MNQLEGILLLIGAPLGLLLAGYWLVTALGATDWPVRPAAAMLAGLGSLILAVSVMNFFVPLRGLAAWACLLPVFVSPVWPKSRALLGHDLRTLAGQRSSWAGGALLVLFFLLLLWPLLRDPMIVLYDGAGNHDNFFWVVNAGHLMDHTYMQHPLRDPFHPMPGAADAVIGWWPAWGRMGMEGLLALCSSLTGLSPLKLYPYFTVSLYLPWLAAGLLAVRTFYAERLSLPARVTVLVLSPVFIFFQRNANLPNLLGVIMGSSAIAAVEMALRAGRGQLNVCLAWCALTALSLHGLYCAYSEMIPFVLLPCGLLWLRSWLPTTGLLLEKRRHLVAGAVAVSLLLNPASTFRAGWGFYAAVLSARADDRWDNILEKLHPVQYLPVLGTLAPPAAIWLGPVVGGLLSLLILTGLALTWRRARDRVGVLLAFSGSIVLLLYTLVTQFTYGWQKSVQFSGIFLSVAVSGALIDALINHPGRSGLARFAARAGAAALAAFLVFAVAMQCREIFKWSGRKVISRDWFTLREISRHDLPGNPVLVEPATFRMGFFYGMWAAYFLPDNPLYYGVRGEQNGGYLRSNVINEADQPVPPSAAVLMGRAWADIFEAGSPRLATGREYVLLSRANRVYDLTGVFPSMGVPELASSHIALQIKPVAPLTLQMELAPPAPEDRTPRTWRIHRRAEDGSEYSSEIAGPPPWRVGVPLVARQKQSVTVKLAATDGLTEEYPFMLSRLQISRDPIALAPDGGKINFTAGFAWDDYHLSGLDIAAGVKEVLAGPNDVVLWFVPSPAGSDVELELVAEPKYRAGARPVSLPTELWFNDTLVFTGFFSEPGVLRARIFSEHWSQQPIAHIRLRFPNVASDGPRLFLKTLTTRRATSPRP